MRINIDDFKTDQDQVYDIKLYTIMGSEAFLDESGYPRLRTESENVCAKAIKNKKGKAMNSPFFYRFYIKTDPNKQPFNPIDTHAVLDKQQHSFLNKICKTEYSFTEVSENAFNSYIDFLRTKNTLLLNNVHRSLK